MRSLKVFAANEVAFHTGWFVESLATQTLVLFVIRTAGNPFRSRPSAPLVATCLAVVATGLYLPFSPVARLLGFTPLSAGFYGFIAAATLSYPAMVEGVKRWLLRGIPRTPRTRQLT